MNKSWKEFTLKIPITVPLTKIMDAWNSRDALESWFLRKAEFYDHEGNIVNSKDNLKAGYTYTWYWHGFDDSTFEKGEIISITDCSLVFSFGKTGDVKVESLDEKGENIIKLTQYNIPDDEESKFSCFMECNSGWTFYLANLKSILENGYDLRNKKLDIKNVINS